VIAVVAILVVAGIGAVLLFGVGSPGGGNDGSQNVQPGNNVLTTGSFTTAVSNVVGAAGGSIAVASQSNPLNGFSLQIPSGAASEAVSYAVRYADINQVSGLPNGTKVVSKMIQIEATGSQLWNKFKVLDAPALLTLPYDQSKVTDENNVRFYRYEPTTRSLSATGFINQDTAANTITFAISTFSNFTAIEVAMEYFEGKNISVGYDTGFRPKSDGFFIPNQGSYVTAGGNCLGMSAFAKWYYRWQKPVSGTNLYDMYREGDRAEWRDDATAIQLASRASLDSTWKLNIPEMTRINSPSRTAGVSLIHGMIVSGEPQVIGLYTQYTNGTWNQGSHAILAYKYGNGAFDTYDPNDPGTASGTAKKLIPFNYTRGFSQIYESGLTAGVTPLQFNWFFHAGDKVFTPDSAFKGLYDSAEKKFADNSIFPTVKLTDPSSTPTGTTPEDTNSDDMRDTTDNKITLSGTITGGQQAVSSTLIFVSGQKFETPVVNGAFSQVIPLFTGTNDIIVLATDANTMSKWAGFLRDSVKCTASVASLTVTMSWGQSDSDVDLHILEPTMQGTAGRHIYYQNKGYDSNSPYLDFDNTYGYGPEHYYATDGMKLPNSPDNNLYGTYAIRVHYYADHDANTESVQPITWSVHVRYLAFKNQQTGDEIWEEESFSGYLSSANSGSSDSFSASDSSWSSVHYFTYNQPDPTDYAIPAPPPTVIYP
jgi:uncharacterized protein YfaP (DUF2135 family)